MKKENLQLKIALAEAQARLLQLQLNIVGDQYEKHKQELEALEKEEQSKEND